MKLAPLDYIILLKDEDGVIMNDNYTSLARQVPDMVRDMLSFETADHSGSSIVIEIAHKD